MIGTDLLPSAPDSLEEAMMTVCNAEGYLLNKRRNEIYVAMSDKSPPLRVEANLSLVASGLRESLFHTLRERYYHKIQLVVTGPMSISNFLYFVSHMQTQKGSWLIFKENEDGKVFR